MNEAESIGYIVLAKRPSRTEGAFNYRPAGSVWPDSESCEGHRAYCAGMAARDFPNDAVEYVIGEIRLREDRP